jgi:hypothetical protein
VFQAGSGGGGFRVASQKSGPVASDVPRFARQHTNIAGMEEGTEYIEIANGIGMGVLSATALHI